MSDKSFFSKLETQVRTSCQIDNGLFEEFDVKRGLRNKDGTGVLVGLTNIGDVVGYRKEDGKVIAIPGRLLYRGIDIEDITHGFQKENRHGFDETVYLVAYWKSAKSGTTQGIFRSYGLLTLSSG